MFLAKNRRVINIFSADQKKYYISKCHAKQRIYKWVKNGFQWSITFGIVPFAIIILNRIYYNRAANAFLI